MNQSMKAAWVAFGIIISLTVAKFVLYKISGSLAVLSEAWHSLSDIATTFLVLLSIYRQQQKENKRESLQSDKQSSPANRERAKGKFLSFISKAYAPVHAVNTELKISLVIAAVLLTAAGAIIYKVFIYKPEPIELPVLTGIIFIGLSFVSFFIYRFEENIGSTEQSAALKADSQHNRADMAISLVTGCSLIIYHFGVNLDRWIGLFIAVYIFTFATELLVNTTRSIIHNKSDIEREYNFHSVALLCFQPEHYKKLYRFIDRRIKISHRIVSMLKCIPVILKWLATWSLRLGIATCFVLYLSTSLYSIQPEEEAILLRFGKIVNTEHPISPGLHLKFPFPIDNVVRYKTGRLQTLQVGNSSAGASPMIWTREHGDNKMFISGDNNLFLPYMIIHYRIKNIHRYYLHYRNGTIDKVITATANRLLNKTFSNTPFYDLLIYKRRQWTEAVRLNLQGEQDRLQTGIEIVDLCLKDMHPPIELAGAFEDVVAAEQLREKYLNDAERQVNRTISREQIQSLKTIGEAESYVLEKKKVAQGEAANYLMRYQGYQAGGGIIKNVLLLDAAEKTLKNKKIIFIDPKSGIDEHTLYLENYVFGRNKR